MVDAVATCLRKYFVFSGRATRAEYWWFFLFCLIVIVASVIIDEVAGTDWITGAAGLFLTVPTLSAASRRLHDSGKSGWRLLIGIVPLGGIFTLVWLLERSTGDNKYGPAPTGQPQLDARRLQVPADSGT